MAGRTRAALAAARAQVPGLLDLPEDCTFRILRLLAFPERCARNFFQPALCCSLEPSDVPSANRTHVPPSPKLPQGVGALTAAAAVHPTRRRRVAPVCKRLCSLVNDATLLQDVLPIRASSMEMLQAFAAWAAARGGHMRRLELDTNDLKSLLSVPLTEGDIFTVLSSTCWQSLQPRRQPWSSSS